MKWSECAPGLTQFRGYQRAWLRGDVLAGVTVAAYLVPQVMAYATVAGLEPVAGLWAALAPLAVYAVLGSSRQLSVGPESTASLMTASALARSSPVPGALRRPGGPPPLVGGICCSCLIGGSSPTCCQASAGQLHDQSRSYDRRLSASSPVKVSGDGFLTTMFLAGMSAVHWPTVVLSMSVLALLLVRIGSCRARRWP